MKIEKSKISKALKQIGVFVGKNSIAEFASTVHFRNKDGKAVIFATDLNSAGRAYINTDESEELDFCIDYSSFLQATKLRSKEISIEKFSDRVNENGEKMSGIDFYDEKTKLTYALKNPDELLDVENKTTIDNNANYLSLKAKFLKDAITNAGYARNERETQNIFITGANFTYGDGIVTVASTDRTRIACFKQNIEDNNNSQPMQAVLSPKTIASIMVFDDDEDIKFFVGESEVVIVSDMIETFSTKILSDFPDVTKFFELPIANSYEVSVNDILESLAILKGENITDIKLENDNNTLKLSSELPNGTYLEDSIDCVYQSGEKDSVWLDINFFTDVFKHLEEEKATIETRISGEQKMFSYKSGSLQGIIAPKKKQ